MIKKTSLKIQESRKSKGPEYPSQLLVALNAHSALLKVDALRMRGDKSLITDILREYLNGKTRFSVRNGDFAAVEHAQKEAQRTASWVVYFSEEKGMLLHHEWYGKGGKILATMRFEIEASLWVTITAWKPRVATSDS